jgi:hypothetical protein
VAAPASNPGACGRRRPDRPRDQRTHPRQHHPERAAGDHPRRGPPIAPRTSHRNGRARRRLPHCERRQRTRDLTHRTSDERGEGRAPTVTRRGRNQTSCSSGSQRPSEPRHDTPFGGSAITSSIPPVSNRHWRLLIVFGVGLATPVRQIPEIAVIWRVTKTPLAHPRSAWTVPRPTRRTRPPQSRPPRSRSHRARRPPRTRHGARHAWRRARPFVRRCAPECAGCAGPRQPQSPALLLFNSVAPKEKRGCRCLSRRRCSVFVNAGALIARSHRAQTGDRAFPGAVAQATRRTARARRVSPRPGYLRRVQSQQRPAVTVFICAAGARSQMGNQMGNWGVVLLSWSSGWGRAFRLGGRLAPARQCGPMARPGRRGRPACWPSSAR